MKWILVVMTFWRPDVTVKTVEVEYDTEQACLDAMYELEVEYLKHENDGFGWVMSCQEEESEDE